VQVERHSLVHRIGEFARNMTVKHELEKHGPNCLPLVLVDGVVLSSGRYPTREEMAAWTGIRSDDLPRGSGREERGGG